MERLTNKITFAEYLPEIVKLHQEFNERFPTGMANLDVANELARVFKGPNLTHIDFYEIDGSIKFFSCIEILSPTSAFWWMIYSHPRNREATKSIVKDIKKHLFFQGISSIESLTTRVTPSYKRWMKSLNFYPSKVHYKCNLQNEF